MQRLNFTQTAMIFIAILAGILIGLYFAFIIRKAVLTKGERLYRKRSKKFQRKYDKKKRKEARTRRKKEKEKAKREKAEMKAALKEASKAKHEESQEEDIDDEINNTPDEDTAALETSDSGDYNFTELEQDDLETDDGLAGQDESSDEETIQEEDDGQENAAEPKPKRRLLSRNSGSLLKNRLKENSSFAEYLASEEGTDREAAAEEARKSQESKYERYSFRRKSE